MKHFLLLAAACAAFAVSGSAQCRTYRVNVCAHPVLGKVKFDIFDTRGKLLFSSDHANGKTFVDFKMATTQQLMVRVSVPASKSAILHEGCLTVLIGSKP